MHLIILCFYLSEWSSCCFKFFHNLAAKNDLLWISLFGGRLILPVWTTSIPSLLGKLSPTWNPLVHVFCTKRYCKMFLDLIENRVCFNSSNITDRNHDQIKDAEKSIFECESSRNNTNDVENESMDTSL